MEKKTGVFKETWEHLQRRLQWTKLDIFQGKSNHLQLCFWWSNSVFLMRPQDFYSQICSHRISFFKKAFGHFLPCLWQPKPHIFHRKSGHFEPRFRWQNWVLLRIPQDISSHACGELNRHFQLKHNVVLSITTCFFTPDPNHSMSTALWREEKKIKPQQPFYL